MPFVAKPVSRSAADRSCEFPPELFGPRPYRLVRYHVATLCPQVFDHPQAQGKPEIQPDRMRYHVGRETMAFVDAKLAPLASASLFSVN